MYRPAPGVSAGRGETSGRYHRSRPEVRAQPLDGAGLCLHHGEEGAHTLERILSLPYRGRFYPEEPHAIRGDDEESQFPGGTGQRVCAGARGCDRVYPHRDCQVQAGSFLYLC